MSIFDELTETFSVKKATVDVAMPLDSHTQIVFTFATVADFANYRKAIMAAADFGKEAEARKPNLVAMYGDDLISDAATAASCHFMSHTMKEIRKERVVEDGENEVIEREDKPWNTRTLMRFAKRCGPAFMAFAQRVDNALNVVALEGEADAIEDAKKNFEITSSSETPSSSPESAGSDIQANGVPMIGEMPATSSPSV